MTRRLVQAGELIGIELMDHIILGGGTFFSFRAEGLRREDSLLRLFRRRCGRHDPRRAARRRPAVRRAEARARQPGGRRVGRVGRARAEDRRHGAEVPRARTRRTRASGSRRAGSSHDMPLTSPCTITVTTRSNEIYAAIDRSALSEAGKARAIEMFRRLAEAEAAIHGIADRQGAPARGRRDRLDHRHRRRGVRARMVRGRSHRRVADQRRRRHGDVRARRVPGAGAGDGGAAGGRAGLFERHADGTADADRRADPDGVRRRRSGRCRR